MYLSVCGFVYLFVFIPLNLNGYGRGFERTVARWLT